MAAPTTEEVCASSPIGKPGSAPKRPDGTPHLATYRTARGGGISPSTMTVVIKATKYERVKISWDCARKYVTGQQWDFWAVFSPSQISDSVVHDTGYVLRCLCIEDCLLYILRTHHNITKTPHSQVLRRLQVYFAPESSPEVIKECGKWLEDVRSLPGSWDIFDALVCNLFVKICTQITIFFSFFLSPHEMKEEIETKHFEHTRGSRDEPRCRATPHQTGRGVCVSPQPLPWVLSVKFLFPPNDPRSSG